MLFLNVMPEPAAHAASSWWMRFLPPFLNASTNGTTSLASPTGSAATETEATSFHNTERFADFDEVLLPPGATAETTTTTISQQAENSLADGTAAANAAAAVSPERTLNEMDPKTDTTASAEGTTAADITPPAAGTANVTLPAGTNGNNTAPAHPVLTAALTAGIDTEAKFAQLSAEAIAGREALAAARADANAAAVAFYGQKDPEKIKAAEQLIAGTSNLSQLSLLADNWHAGAPGGNHARTEAGEGVRQTRPHGPSRHNVARENGSGTDEQPTPPARSAAGTSSIYDQYNRPAGGGGSH